MNVRDYDLQGIRIVELPAAGPLLRTGRDAVDTIAAASPHRAEILVIPAERLDADFFRLRTGVAGEIVQKFVTYRLRVAILGDISSYLEESSALRDFVYESNSGPHVWFVNDAADLSQRLRPPGGAP